ncbi:hypothetical protein F4778DRAFT_731036 [Xylariomycetidae sp. FL2044]|nr:hypothetical protein F4778DRAFT_731036 [Xylariomycetidae sp. FL2044]
MAQANMKQSKAIDRRHCSFYNSASRSDTGEPATMLSLYAASLVGLALPLVPVYASPFISSRHHEYFPLPSRVVAQLPADETNGFIENIAVRSNGDLLLTTFSPTAALYTIENPSSSTTQLTLLHQFEGGTSTFGIVETFPDTFVLTSSYLDGLTARPNTTKLWEVKFDGAKRGSFTTRKIADVDEAQGINGMAAVPGANAVLAADLGRGEVCRIDLTTGAYETVLAVPEVQPVPGGAFVAGVNGLKIHGGYLYWSNSNRVALYRIRINGNGYPVVGAAVEEIATIEGATLIDDFALDAHDNIWAATNVDNSLVVVGTDRSQQVVLGSPTELTLAGDTAVAFGRTPRDRHIAYVTTSGAQLSPVNGTITEPGKVVAVDARGYWESRAGVVRRY